MKNNHKIRYAQDGTPYIPCEVKDTKEGVFIQYFAWHTERLEIVRKKFYAVKGNSKREKIKFAREKAADIDFLLAQGYTVGGEEERKKETITVQQAFQEAINYKLKESDRITQLNYSSFWNVYSYWLTSSKIGEYKMSRFRKKDIFKFFDYLFEERDVSNSTRNNYKNKVRALCSILVERGIIKENPASGIRDLPVSQAKNIPFTESQQSIMERYMQHNSPRLYLFTRFIYYGFMRPQEVCIMKVGHIDVKNRVILKRASKTKSRKQTPVWINKRH